MSKACAVHRMRCQHSHTLSAFTWLKQLMDVWRHMVSGGEHEWQKQLIALVPPIPLLYTAAVNLPPPLSRFRPKAQAGGCWVFRHLCCLGSTSLSNQEQNTLANTFLVSGLSFGPNSPDHQLIEGLMDGLPNVCVCVCHFLIHTNPKEIRRNKT